MPHFGRNCFFFISHVQQTPFCYSFAEFQIIDSLHRHQLPCSLGEATYFFPALLFGLIVVWPNLIEFCVNCCCRNVGLSFCPLQERTWQKWFSTQSWLMIAGFITELGNLVSLIATRACKPRHIDWRSNQSLLEINSFLFSLVWASHCTINLWKASSFLSLPSAVLLMCNLSLNRLVISLVYCNIFIDELHVRLLPSFPVALRCSWCFYNGNITNCSHVSISTYCYM